MKLKLISGIYKKIEADGKTTYGGYGIVDENLYEIAYLTWDNEPNKTHAQNIVMHRQGESDRRMPTLGHGISKIKQLYVELTNAN